MILKYLPTIALATITLSARAQKCPVWKNDCNPVAERAIAVHFNAGGPTGIASADISGYITNAIKIHGGLGYLGAFIGATCDAPIHSRHWSVYAGVDLSVVEGNQVVFIPVGAQYIFCNRVSLGGEVLPGWSREDGRVITGALKIGYCLRRGQ